MEKETHSFNTNINIPLSPTEGRGGQSGPGPPTPRPRSRSGSRSGGTGRSRSGERGKDELERGAGARGIGGMCAGGGQRRLFEVWGFFLIFPTSILRRCQPAVLDVALAKRAKPPEAMEMQRRVGLGWGSRRRGRVLLRWLPKFPFSQALPPLSLFIYPPASYKPTATPTAGAGGHPGDGRVGGWRRPRGPPDAPAHIPMWGVQFLPS